MSRPPAIPDIAAETAQGSASNPGRGLADTQGGKLDKATLVALIDEIEACRHILAEAAKD